MDKDAYTVTRGFTEGVRSWSVINQAGRVISISFIQKEAEFLCAQLNQKDKQKDDMSTIIKFRRSDENAVIPSQATPGSAGFDLTSTGVTYEKGVFIVSTGLHTSFPEGYVLKVFGRSGLCRRQGVILANGVGIIDSDYRGEIQLMFRFVGRDELYWQILEELGTGNRVAQAILEPLPTVGWVEVPELSDTARGTGGFGSTGS